MKGFLIFPINPYLLEVSSIVPILSVFNTSVKILRTDSLIFDDVEYFLDTREVSFVIASLETRFRVKLSCCASEITSVILET